MGDHFCLKWNNHQANLTGIMTKLLDEQKFVDVSLVCEMKTFKAHQTVLSACSPYFEQVLEENPHPHPIIILRDVKESEMAALLQYMYRGEVSVRDDELSAFLNMARALKVRGLSENKKELLQPTSREIISQDLCITQEVSSPPKRQRTTMRTIDLEVTERLHSDFQLFPNASNVNKPCTKLSNSGSGQSATIYSESSNETHYTDVPTPNQIIKQEVENMSGPTEESNVISHHLEDTESKNGHCSKAGEWNFTYGQTSESRNYQTQKAQSSGYSDVHPSATSVQSSFLDPSGSDIFDGSKQWQIKYAFEKVEGSGFKCKICGQIKKHVRNHFLKHFPEHHECHLCRRTYTRKDNLHSHLKRDHFQRVKTPPEPYQRLNLKKLSRKIEEYQSFKCFTPDIYSHVKFSSALSTNLLSSHIPRHQSQTSSASGPMDLSLRPNSVPVQPQCAPIYDILPSLYNYFRS